MTHEGAVPPTGRGTCGISRRAVLRPLAGVVAAVAAVIGAVALIDGLTAGDDPPPPRLPPVAANLTRMDDAVDLAAVRGALQGRGEAGAYGRTGATRADVIVVVAADRRSGAAQDKLDRFYAELRDSDARVDPATVRRQDPGPLGGIVQCHPVVYPRQNLTLDMCVWADGRSVGSVLALAGADNVDSPDELARTTRDMRAAVADTRERGT
ncbi:hypothetical protein [Yinghuangia sp. YIM S09857]|uniref:hypothetical protein n=1 Tax=Yinghuangia sp. YIM S09857 TaxID=3436929 RepID=UPI003F529D9D